jgi:hypothetical protein
MAKRVRTIREEIVTTQPLILSTTDQGNDRIGAKAELMKTRQSPNALSLITIDTSHTNPLIPLIRCTKY